MSSGNRVWIVGAGGVGCVLGARLELAHPGSVVFIDAWAEHVRTIQSDGLIVDHPEGPVQVRPAAVLLDHLDDLNGVPDLVVLAVKAYDTAEIIDRIQLHIGTAPVLSLQNSINEEHISTVLGADRTMGGVCLYSAGLLGPGHAVQAMAGGKIVIGELDGTVKPRTEHFAELLRVSVPVRISDNIWGELWTKLVRNAMVNGMAAATDLGMGELVLVPGADRICIGLGSEAVRVAVALGHRTLVTEDLFDCPYEYPLEWYLRPVGSVERNQLEQSFHDSWVPHPTVYPSLLQDMRKGRRTEIEALNGYVADKGHQLGLPTPLNRALTDLVLQCSSAGTFGDPGTVCKTLLPLVG